MNMMVSPTKPKNGTILTLTVNNPQIRRGIDGSARLM